MFFAGLSGNPGLFLPPPEFPKTQFRFFETTACSAFLNCLALYVVIPASGGDHNIRFLDSLPPEFRKLSFRLLNLPHVALYRIARYYMLYSLPSAGNTTASFRTVFRCAGQENAGPASGGACIFPFFNKARKHHEYAAEYPGHKRPCAGGYARRHRSDPCPEAPGFCSAGS